MFYNLLMPGEQIVDVANASLADVEVVAVGELPEGSTPPPARQGGLMPALTNPIEGDSNEERTESAKSPEQQFLVPGGGFEPPWVTPHAPQACASAKFRHPGTG